MRIISNFTDYYDCIQRVAQDKTLVYIRNRSDEKVDKDNNYGNIELLYSRIKIEFCGNYYDCYRMRHRNLTAFCYNIEDIDRFVIKSCSEKIANSVYFEPKHKWSGSSRNYFVDKFSKYKTYKHSTKCCFETPILVADYHKGIIIKNACLKDYEFFRIFNPVMAFQELSMYLGSLAMPIKPEPVMSNDDKIESHGFNKFSFRKDKIR